MFGNEFSNTQDLVDIEEIRENTAVLKGGRLVHVIMVDGINFALKSEQEQDLLIYAYQNFLNSIDFPIQIVIHSRKINIEKYLARLQEREREEPSEILQNQLAEYRNFIETFVRDNAIMQKSFFVVLSFVPLSSSIPTSQEGLRKFIPFLKTKGAASPTPKTQGEERSFKEALAQLQQRTDQVLDGLSAIGLEAEQLKNEELAELFYNFYNPETIERKQLGILSNEVAKGGA